MLTSVRLKESFAGFFGPTDTTAPAPAPAARGTLDRVEATWTLFSYYHD